MMLGVFLFFFFSLSFCEINSYVLYYNVTETLGIEKYRDDDSDDDDNDDDER